MPLVPTYCCYNNCFSAPELVACMRPHDWNQELEKLCLWSSVLVLSGPESFFINSYMLEDKSHVTRSRSKPLWQILFPTYSLLFHHAPNSFCPSGHSVSTPSCACDVSAVWWSGDCPPHRGMVSHSILYDEQQWSFSIVQGPNMNQVSSCKLLSRMSDYYMHILGKRIIWQGPSSVMWGF